MNNETKVENNNKDDADDNLLIDFNDDELLLFDFSHDNVDSNVEINFDCNNSDNIAIDSFRNNEMFLNNNSIEALRNFDNDINDGYFTTIIILNNKIYKFFSFKLIW
jgi:hypothetical protein